MRRIIDWSLSYPGVKQVEHVYFYSATIADQTTITSYLKRAYDLGAGFQPEETQAGA